MVVVKLAYREIDRTLVVEKSVSSWLRGSEQFRMGQGVPEPSCTCRTLQLVLVLEHVNSELFSNE